jgi:hypothetical protein
MSGCPGEEKINAYVFLAGIKLREQNVYYDSRRENTLDRLDM